MYWALYSAKSQCPPVYLDLSSGYRLHAGTRTTTTMKSLHKIKKIKIPSLSSETTELFEGVFKQKIEKNWFETKQLAGQRRNKKIAGYKWEQRYKRQEHLRHSKICAQRVVNN